MERQTLINYLVLIWAFLVRSWNRSKFFWSVFIVVVKKTFISKVIEPLCGARFVENSQVLEVRYYQNQKLHRVFLPYKVSPRSSVFLEKEDGEIDISQQPGVPYFVNAKQLGGERIRVETLDSDEIFDSEEIPNC